MSSINSPSSVEAAVTQMSATTIDNGTQTTTGTTAAPIVEQMSQGFVKNNDDNAAALFNKIGVTLFPRQLYGSAHKRPYNQNFMIRSLRDAMAIGPFLELNPKLCPQFVPCPILAPIPVKDIVTICANGVNIFIHRHVIEKSGMLQRAFVTEMTEGRTGVMTVEGDYKTWVIVIAAMYGSTSVPVGFYVDKPALRIIEAVVKADYILAAPEVKQNIWDMLTTHFSLFEHWKDIPYNLFTLVDHQNRAFQINEAWKAYKALPDHIHKPFNELGFGLIIHMYCPGQAYDNVEDLFDDGLVRILARVAKRRLCGMTFDAAAWNLFKI